MPEKPQFESLDALPGFPGGAPLRAAIEEIEGWRIRLQAGADVPSAQLVNVALGSLRMCFEALAIAAYTQEPRP